MAIPGLFDYSNAMTGQDAVGGVKNNLLLNSDEPDIQKGFDPFMVRRCLAQNQDTLVCAEQMNLLHSCDKWMQWCYGFYAIPARKRYGKWSKKGPDNPDLVMLSDFYQISPEKAADYLRMFTEEQMKFLRTEYANRLLNEKPKKAK